MNRCTWTENIKKERPNYIGITSFQEQCENMTEEQFDEYGRVYCKEHRIKVDEINKSRHKNCINKEKLINFIITTRKENKESDSSNLFKIGKESGLFNLQIYINEGDFDNE
ncbi:hypothetical protein [Spiroplasma endosymbiont of Tricholauxania praeusta]|uniref:hypothetical protein n=1 Tax=Spiroplasma endosymbiont of Tricholauxania praeusta TaxID=3066296 RepID=UPI0030CBA1A3